eukprot:TRINITY_DN1643_c0_g1_i1.p1 TRINITY_DN1643_c0_g1~~TRINITY_DN1643_c0_g1_i1.p1  ORF type:complete len:313 (-),score=66.91 TRINITY_DN1643_c0_g1_i1:113-1051(-)
MSSSVVLVTGATGLLGRSIMKALRESGFDHLVGVSLNRKGPQIVQCDLLDNEKIASLLNEHKPSVVIHCAAERKPDVCESSKDGTWKLNVGTTLAVAENVQKMGAFMIYISTDYIFDGKNPPYQTDSKPNPLSFYGQTKLAGEEAMFSVHPKGCVLRVPLLYGSVENLVESGPTSLAKVVIDSKPVTMDDWQIRFPTLTDDVAIVVKNIVVRYFHDVKTRPDSTPSVSGVFHMSGDQQMTKYDIVCEIGKILDLPTDHVKPDKNAPHGVVTQRPYNAQLSISKTVEVLGAENVVLTPFQKVIGEILSPHLNK